MKSTNKRTLRYYWDHTKKYKVDFFLTLLNFPNVFLRDIIAPLIIATIVDRVIQDHNNLQLSNFYGLMFIFVAAWVIGVILNRISFHALNRLETKVMRSLANFTFERLTQHSVGFFNNRFSGSLVAQSNRFYKAYFIIMDSLILDGSHVFIILGFSWIVLAFYSIPLSLLMFVMTALISTLVYKMARERMPLRRAANEAESIQTGQLADALTNVQVIKMFAHEDQEQKAYDEKAVITQKLTVKSWIKAVNNGNIVMLLTGLMQLLMLLLLIQQTLSGAITIGVFILAQIYITRSINELFAISRMARNIEASLGDAHEMTETLSVDQEILDIKDAKPLKVSKGEIAFKEVIFKYQDGSGKILFGNLNFTIKPGEKVGLVGPSGGGKSTITKLILRFMDIQDGEIIIDGQDISKVQQKSLRKAISYVPQEPLLFHRTIKENVGYAKNKQDDRAIEQAAKRAHVSEFIKDLPKGLDTVVGERGTKLSGGQKQRVAIARAILKDSPILILDEATSALDSESEKLIQKAIHELMIDKTAIVIAHRLSTIKQLDRILVMDNGSIVEEGTHEELIKKDGLYAKLWAHQTGDLLD